MNTISKIFGALVFALLLASCDFHGPWEYYPEEREVYTGIYTYGYILSEGNPDVCFSKVYELDEISTKDFAFYDSAYVTVQGKYSDGAETEIDTTVRLGARSDKPNCFTSDGFHGIKGESYVLEAYFEWDSIGHKAKSRYKAVATIPNSVKVKGLNLPQPDGSYKWQPNSSNDSFTVQFLEFPLDMEFVKCAMDYDKSVRGVISIMNYGLNTAESQNTTFNQMFKGMTKSDSTGYRGIAMHDPLETQQNLGFTSNRKVADFYALDTLYLMNMMMPIGDISVDFYATDDAYIDYDNKVKASLTDSRIVPESNIENGMGVFSGMAKSSIYITVQGNGVSMEHIAIRNCSEKDGDHADSWDSKGCRLYQDVVCSGIPTDEFDEMGLLEANKRAYEYYRDTVVNRNEPACYASSVKAAMMLDTTKWSLFLPESISDAEKNAAYADGLKRYCVANNFESNKIADCGELKELCLEGADYNYCKDYLWTWCADRNWNMDYEQCRIALVERYKIEAPKSNILKERVESICREYKYSACNI